MSKNTRIFLLLSLLILLILACTLPSSQSETNDPNIVFTAAAETASVQLTEVAINNISTQAPSSPPTIAPSLTPAIPTSVPTEDNCDKAKFIEDVTIPDGTILSPGESFKKTWRVENTGTCTWTTGYALVIDSGSQMSGPSPQPLTGTVAPGEIVDISVHLIAPPTNGSYRGNWQIRNTSDELFAKVYVQIEVGHPEFAVTSVNVSSTGTCGNFLITAAITTNGPGEVTYNWERSDSGVDNANHPTLVYTSASTKSVSTSWSLGASGSHWMDIYIDDPNHQQFGRANLNCP
ncbi:MAG: hypothetical protein HN392_01120 [Anaerolineae bacterium]|nr:hypothetical protein [Anaerolineae bacterium]MBT7073880.1 hypothetical protein [Anaerolineae bacterium]MBT7781722.1 hypothetical protein [Anaerolineae bacterium]